MLVLSANDITFFYSCYLENNPSSNDIIHICCQLFSNYLRECVVFLSMLVLMPLLSVEVLLCTCLYKCNRMVMNMLCSICFFRNVLELLTLCGSIVPGAPKHYSGD